MFKEIKQFDRVDFSTSIPFRITDHNYGDHVANNVFVEYLHEGRVQLLEAFGYTEKDVAGVALIMSELHVKYTKQAFYPGELELELSVTNLRPTRFDIFYRGYDRAGDLVLLATTEMAGLDTKTGKPIRLPDAFTCRFREQE
jgi:acyl-CoA thioester hydrolase